MEVIDTYRPPTLDMDIDTVSDIDDDTDTEPVQLDMKWLSDIEQHNNDYGKFYKDDVFTMNVVFIHANCDKNIEHVSSMKVDLENKNIFTQHELANIIQTKNKVNKTKYRLISAYLYNIDIEPDDLLDFIKKHTNPASEQFFNKLDLARDIIIHPTIAQFHKMNTLYLIMGERRERDTKANEGRTRKIKRVTFHPDIKQTRKRMYTNVNTES